MNEAWAIYNRAAGIVVHQEDLRPISGHPLS